MSDAVEEPTPTLRLEFCDEWFDLPLDRPFTIGRDADPGGGRQPVPPSQVPRDPVQGRDVVAGQPRRPAVGHHLLKEKAASRAGWPRACTCRSSSRSCTCASRPVRPPTSWRSTSRSRPSAAASTPRPTRATPPSGWVLLTRYQKLPGTRLLAEPALRPDGSGRAHLPTSAEAATRLGWALTKFNRKLHNVCQKVENAGVRGLTADRIASPRTGEVGSSNTPSPSASSPARIFRCSKATSAMAPKTADRDGLLLARSRSTWG